jgi:hypothetical protein
MIRDPKNDARVIAYFRRSAPYRSAAPCDFKRRYLRGLAIQRDLYRAKQSSPSAPVIQLQRKRRG